jgi:hypothetical protein
MQRKQRSQNRRNKPRRSFTRTRASDEVIQPPPFVPTMALTHRFRFIDGVGGSYTITRASLLNLIVTATSAVTSVRLMEAVRLIKVKLWTNPIIGTGSASASPIQTCSLEWLGENSPSTLTSDSSMGVRPAHIRSSPPPSSSNRWWSLSGSLETDDLFILTTVAGTVLDIAAEIRLVEMEAPTAGPVPAGATIGQVYGFPLDGTGHLLPVGFTQLP